MSAANDMPIRVVFCVTTGLSARPFFQDLFPYLTQHGFDTFLLTNPTEDTSDWCQSQNATLYPVSIRREPSPLADARALISVWRALRDIGPDIIVCGTPKMGLLSAVAARITRKPCIYVVHGLRYETAHGASRAALMLFELLACRAATTVVPVSNSVAENLQNHLHIDPGKMRLVASGSANGIVPRRSVTPRRTVSSETRFAFIGRITADKGIFELAEAWSAHSKGHPGDTLRVYGAAEDTSVDALLDLRNCHLYGHVTDVDSAYEDIDVLVLPSHREGFPTVILEAASWGRPTITTTATGCRDAVIDMQTGWQFPTGDTVALSACLHDASAHPHERARLGMNAKEWATTNFLRARVHEGWRNLLQGSARRRLQ